MEPSPGVNPRMSLNCHVGELQNLWAAILTDAAHAFPTLEREFSKDLSRLQGAVGHRGLRVFLEDLSAVGKHFDRCLSAGQYNLSGLPLTKRYSNKVVIPKFLRGLYLLIFHSTGSLKEDYNVEAIFFVRQLTLAFKKGKLRCSDEANENEVVEFSSVDNSLPEPERFWTAADYSAPEVQGLQPSSSDVLNPNCVMDRDEQGRKRHCESHGCEVLCEETSRRDPELDIAVIYQGFGKSPLYHSRVESIDAHLRVDMSLLLARLDFVSSLVTATLGPYSPEEWRFRHGPGVVSEYVGPANKYYWTNWSEALEREFPIADCGFHNYGSWADSLHVRPDYSSGELESRLICVPKTFSKPRLIAAEPSSKQWCQQNIWHYFRSRSEATWIYKFVRFDDQTLNQQLCKEGSRDDTLATVDLSEASDRVTCHAVGQMFRGNPKLLNCLRASRTQKVSQNVTDKVPSVIPLRKFSTMGNACTFPVESLIFLSIAIATVLTHRKLRATKRNVESLSGEVAVFGDDIVIPSECRVLFTEALKILDFKVNTKKSFWTGRFRESCGVDAYGGVEVTPAYWRIFCDGKPESLASTVDTRNNFYKKFLLTAADRLASTIPRRFSIAQVSMRSGVFGLITFLEPRNYRLRTRWNTDLQRRETLISDIKCREERLPIENDSALLQYFTEEPDPSSRWKSGTPQRPKTKIRPRWVVTADLFATCEDR
jgi:hypothetical protein